MAGSPAAKRQLSVEAGFALVVHSKIPMKLFRPFLASVLISAVSPIAALADAGMGLLNKPPVDQLKQRAAMADKMHGSFDFKATCETMFVAVGSPQTVANKLGEWGQMMGTGHFNMNFHLGDMPHWKVVKSLSLFAEEVMPRLRGTQGQAAAKTAA